MTADPAPQAPSPAPAKPGRGIFKTLFVAVVVVLVLIIAAIAGVLFYIDTIAKTAVERGGTAALGVPTTLSSITIGILRGDVKLASLKVANPQGYDKDYFLTLKSAYTGVEFASLRQDTVVIPKLELDGVDMVLEKKGEKANFQVILDNLKALQSQVSGGGQAPDQKSGGSGKKFVVKEISIRNVTVHVDMKPLGGIGGKITHLDVEIPEIKLTNVGSDTDRGVAMSELTAIVTKAVMDAVIKKAGGILPAELIGPLSDGLAQAGGLGKIGVEAIGGVVKDGGKIIGDLSKTVGDVGKDLGKGVEDITKGFGDAFKGLGGKKDETEKKK